MLLFDVLLRGLTLVNVVVLRWLTLVNVVVLRWLNLSSVVLLRLLALISVVVLLLLLFGIATLVRAGRRWWGRRRFKCFEGVEIF